MAFRGSSVRVRLAPLIMLYFVYIIYSATRDRYYTGHTDNLPKRIEQHNNGYESSTKSGVPWKLKYTEEFKTRSEAMKREYEIKSKKSRKYIEKLISPK